MPILRRDNSLKDEKLGTAVPPRAATGDHPQDYNYYPTGFWNNDNEDRDGNFIDGNWFATANVKFIDGKSFWIPLKLEDENLAEGDQTIIWDITESGFGFAQGVYTVSETDDYVFVELRPNSNITQLTITVTDNDITDQLFNGDAANNALSGSDTNDELYGRGGNDSLTGGNGNDKLYGGYSPVDIDNGVNTSDDGNDSLNGGAGNDFLDGGLGGDTLLGGTGDDVYIVDDLGDIVTENLNEGVDTVKSSINFLLGDNLENLTLIGSATVGIGNALNNKIIGNILFGGDGNDTLQGAYDDDTLNGENGDDILLGEYGDDSLLGGAGNDSLNGGFGNDSLYGEAGNDILDGWDDDDFLYGGAGNDSLAGDLGNDNLYGEDGNDNLYGEDGNDSLDGGLGNNNLDGGVGNDTLLGSLGNDNLVGGDGNDRLNGYGTAVTNDSQIDTLTGGAGGDYFVLGGAWGVSYLETGDGYAIITDWDYTLDRIEVQGNASQYSLDFSRNVAGGSAIDTEIYYIGNGGMERIGVVQDTTNVIIALDFDFV